MTNAIDLLKKHEHEVVISDSEEGLFRGEFSKVWLADENVHRARLTTVLDKLADFGAIWINMWSSYETSFILTNGVKSLWFSYTGSAWHIWTNCHLPEEKSDRCANIVVDDGQSDALQLVVQTIRDSLKSPLLDAA